MRLPVSSVALLLMLAGCGSAPVKNSTVAPQEAAIEANRRGEAYVRHGELDRAVEPHAPVPFEASATISFSRIEVARR